MAYKTGNRNQMTLLPQSIEQFIANDDPVRAYDAFVEALDFNDLGIEINPNKVGNSPYHPKTMLKLLVYGTSYGTRSSRKLERETYHNMSFIWLMGGLKPDHKTIAEFRRNNTQTLKKVLRQCARMCIKLELIAGNVLFVDGTKIRANASICNSHAKGWYEKQLTLIDQRIEQLLADCESTDEQEQHLDSFVTMDKELSQAEKLKNKMQTVLAEFKENAPLKVNSTDPECANMRSPQGKHASYNVQSVVDDKNALILHAEAVSDATDINQFANQIDQANEVLEQPCKTACADAGYAATDELEKIDSKGIRVIVPYERQCVEKPDNPFNKRHFSYDKEHDCYRCPESHLLHRVGTEKKNGKIRYQITRRQICRSCKHFGQCTTSEKGRSIKRLKNAHIKEKLETQYQLPASQLVYARRKACVEHPFGHMKRNLKITGFLLRGREGVQAETSVFGTCFNIARMISLLGGVPEMIRKLQTLVPTV